MNQQIESPSPSGNASVNLLVDDEGNLTAAAGAGSSPSNDNNRYLSWSQLGADAAEDGLVSNAGIGQRWVAGKWLLGYNTFYDNLLDEKPAACRVGRGGVGRESPSVCQLLSTAGQLARVRTCRSSAWRVAMT